MPTYGRSLKKEETFWVVLTPSSKEFHPDTQACEDGNACAFPVPTFMEGPRLGDPTHASPEAEAGTFGSRLHGRQWSTSTSIGASHPGGSPSGSPHVTDSVTCILPPYFPHASHAVPAHLAAAHSTAVPQVIRATASVPPLDHSPNDVFQHVAGQETMDQTRVAPQNHHSRAQIDSHDTIWTLSEDLGYRTLYDICSELERGQCAAGLTLAPPCFSAQTPAPPSAALRPRVTFDVEVDHLLSVLDLIPGPVGITLPGSAKRCSEGDIPVCPLSPGRALLKSSLANVDIVPTIAPRQIYPTIARPTSAPSTFVTNQDLARRPIPQSFTYGSAMREPPSMSREDPLLQIAGSRADLYDGSQLLDRTYLMYDPKGLPGSYDDSFMGFVRDPKKPYSNNCNTKSRTRLVPRRPSGHTISRLDSASYPPGRIMGESNCDVSTSANPARPSGVAGALQGRLDGEDRLQLEFSPKNTLPSNATTPFLPAGGSQRVLGEVADIPTLSMDRSYRSSKRSRASQDIGERPRIKRLCIERDDLASSYTSIASPGDVRSPPDYAATPTILFTPAPSDDGIGMPGRPPLYGRTALSDVTAHTVSLSGQYSPSIGLGVWRGEGRTVRSSAKDYARRLDVYQKASLPPSSTLRTRPPLSTPSASPPDDCLDRAMEIVNLDAIVISYPRWVCKALFPSSYLAVTVASMRRMTHSWPAGYLLVCRFRSPGRSLCLHIIQRVLMLIPDIIRVKPPLASPSCPPKPFVFISDMLHRQLLTLR
ncbi:unnamed protein product [Peniophora sp. CBMAI 1063]|nr:unnamed protein product [Peniophora sp. CBMAI 1063]